MTLLSDAILDLVRYRKTVTLDWLLEKTFDRIAHDMSPVGDDLISEIQTTLVNAGWHQVHSSAKDGNCNIHCYWKRLSDQQPPPRCTRPGLLHRFRHRLVARK